MVKEVDIEALAERKSIGDLKSIISDLEEQESLKVSDFDRFAADVNNIINIVESVKDHFIFEGRKLVKERKEHEEILREKNLLPEQKHTVHSDYAIMLKKETENKLNLMQWLDYYCLYLNIVVKKLMEVVRQANAIRATEAFMQEAKDVAERLHETNKEYIKNIGETLTKEMSGLRNSFVDYVRDLVYIIKTKDDFMEKVIENMSKSKVSEKEINELRSLLVNINNKIKNIEASRDETTTDIFEKEQNQQNNEKFVCEMCGTEFKTKEELDEHVPNCVGRGGVNG